MAEPNVDPSTSGDNLFLPVPLVLLSELVSEAGEIGWRIPVPPLRYVLPALSHPSYAA
jgi:hypothetical protein